MLNIKSAGFVLGSSFLLNTMAWSAEYRVDGTYATSGIFRQVGGAIKGVIVQPNGKILLATTMTPAGSSFSSIALLRQDPNGVLDNTFDSDGIQFTGFGTNLTASAGGMAESPLDGKVVVVGNSAGFNSSSGSPVYQSDFAVACFNADGSPDTGFNTTGKATTSFDPITNASKSFPYASAFAECVAVQSDGKIIAAGSAEVGSSSRRFALVRYQTNGAVDTGFGGGLVVTNPGSYCSITAVAISPTDQKIIAVGSYQDPITYAQKCIVARYNTDGTLDTSFDTDGIVITGSGNQNHMPKAVAIQPDNKIVVGGSTYIKNPFAEPEDFALFRYNSDGSLDTGFGTGGFVAIDHAGGYDGIQAIRLQSGGKILAAGTAGGDPADPSSVAGFALLMFNSDGSLNTTFDTDGKVITTGATTREAYRVAQQADGRIIVAGEFRGENGNPGEAAAIRYEMAPVRKTDLLLGLTSNVRLGANIYNNTGAGQTQALDIGFKATKTAYIGIQNDGNAADSFKVRATPGNTDFTVNYFKGARNITAQIVAGTYQTATLPANATEVLKVVTTAKSLRAAKRRILTVSASSVAESTVVDKALFKVTSKAGPK